jgi:pimeloyl-ACP methyl ester carboxylesterase
MTWLTRIIAAMTALALLGAGLQSIAERRSRATDPPPGELVTLGDGRVLHLEVRGERHDGPVVVLETGMGGFSAAWAWVQAALAEHVTVVAYDRPGLGWSDPSPNGPAAEHVVADVREALSEVGLSDRGYVLVGHSLGGHYVRAFAQKHPTEVAGMVLVDPSHERVAQEVPGYADDMRQGGMMMGALHAASRVGLTRLYDPFATVVADLPEPQRSRVLAEQVTPDYYAAYRAEFAALDEIGATLASGDTDLGDLPLVVLVAEHAATASERPAVDAATALRVELGDLSTRGRVERLPSAQHITIVTDPEHAEVVAGTVLDVVAATEE